MSRDENLPFPIGGTAGVTAVTDLTSLEGREYLVEDIDYSVSGVKTYRSNRFRKVRIVRNVSGVNLLPKRLVSFQATNWGNRVDGYVNVLAAKGYPVDEFLPAAGVVNNDLFYIVTDGPAKCFTSVASISATINVGDAVVGATLAASTSDTAGRVGSVSYAGATAVLAVQIINAVGLAMSAKTANNTSADILVDVGYGCK